MIWLGLPNTNNEMIIKWEIIKLREILQIEIKGNDIVMYDRFITLLTDVHT